MIETSTTENKKDFSEFFHPQNTQQAEIRNAVEEHIKVFTEFFSVNEKKLELLAEKCKECLIDGGKIILCGNGGSAADAQHIAAEFVGRFVKERKALPAISLTTDSSIITSIANDFGYDEVFSRQVQALGTPKDIFIGISTSGNSQNVLNAIQTCQEAGIYTVGLAGKDGGALTQACNTCFTVKSNITARTQECHIAFLHILCELIERDF